MKQRLLFSLLASGIFFVSGCDSSKSHNTQLKKDTLSEVRSPDKIPFAVFFKEFKSDSAYQVAHINFPLKTIIYENDTEASEYTLLKDWQYDTFFYDESFSKREVDAYTQDIVNQGDSVTILKYNGVDNGIHIEYVFKQKDANWLLEQINDYSN